MSTTSNTGAIGENLVINDLLKHNHRVYKEVTAGNDVDLIVDNGIRLFRIQVKTHAECKHGVLPLTIERRWRDKAGNWARARYTTDTVDVIAAVSVDHGVIAYVPISEFGDQITMCLRFEEARNGQKKSVRNVSDFTTEKIIGA